MIEIEDQPWCPNSIRDALTDFLQFALNLGNHYACVVSRLRRALERTGTHQVVDLCSGAGGPWPGIIRVFEKNEDYLVEVCLTDKYPNMAALERVRLASNNRITFHPVSVDATQMPSDLKGFRTLFTSFHHFPPPDARAILRDAVNNRQGIGVFEVTKRHPIALLIICFFVPLIIFAFTPFIRPFRWSRLMWTYLIPIVPFVGWFDGIVSCFRAYSLSELRELTNGLSQCGYTWDIGEERYWASRFPVPITYLIGCPAEEL